MSDTELKNHHDLAMAYAEEGFFLQRKNNHSEATSKFGLAFKAEQVVADHLIASQEDVTKIEPSRSIICVSCAALAKDAGLLSEAKKYADKVIEFNFDSYFVEEAQEIIAS